MNRSRLIAIISSAVVAAGLIVYGFIPAAVRVDAARAAVAPMRAAVEEEGRTRVIDRFVVSAPSAGYLKRIVLKAGDAVAGGQTVAALEPLRPDQLDPRSRAAAEAALSAAEASLKAALENARAAGAARDYQRARLDRTERLFREGVASRDEYEGSKSEADRADAVHGSAEAAAKAALHEAERARAALAYPAGGRGAVPVASPSAGKVLRVHRESEGAVAAGQPLIEVGDPSRIEVISEVLSADAVNIRPGMRVEFRRWGGGAVITGKVRTVEPSGFTKVSSLGVEEQRVVVTSDITSPPEEWAGLGDGYRVEAAFIVWEAESVLQVPAGAVYMKPEGGFEVFVIQDGRAAARKVEVLRRNGLSAAITSGLSEGELVITHPEDTVREGVRVKAR